MQDCFLQKYKNFIFRCHRQASQSVSLSPLFFDPLFLDSPHLFRMPYYFCGEPDIALIAARETENSTSDAERLYQLQTSPSRRLSRQASTSIHVISRAPPLLEYLNILSSRRPPPGFEPPPCTDAIRPPPTPTADAVLFIFINAFLISYEQKCLLGTSRYRHRYGVLDEHVFIQRKLAEVALPNVSQITTLRKHQKLYE